MKTEDENAIVQAIASLRAHGDDKRADILEARLAAARASSRMDSETLEGCREIVKFIKDTVEAKGIDLRRIERFDEWTREDAFDVMQRILSVTRGRAREAAIVLGIDRAVVEAWSRSELYRQWLESPGRVERSLREASDLAISKMKYILSLDSQSTDVLKMQTQLIRQMMSSRPTVQEPPPPPPPRKTAPRPEPRPVLPMAKDDA